jgi:alkylhydroperoxidase family enzyme
VPRISLSALGDTTADRAMGHRPDLLEAWENLKRVLVGPNSTLSTNLKEEVRRTLAQRTGCQFCASLGLPAGTHSDRKESLAVAFAEAVACDHTAITDAQVKLLLEEFTEAQVVELLMWICFEYAGQMFGCLIGDQPASAEEKKAFAAWIASLPA